MTFTGDNTTTHTPDAPARVDPTYAWALAATPLVAALLPLAFPTISDTAALWVAVAINSVLVVADLNRLKAVGIEINALLALLVVPLYLVLRTKRANSTPAIPVVWVAAFLVALALPNLAAGQSVGSDGGTGSNTVRMDSNTLESQLTGLVAKQVGGSESDVTVSCPSSIEADLGSPFPCDVSASDGSSGSVYVTVNDAAGHYDWQLTN